MTHDLRSDTWAGTDALGRALPMHAEVGPSRPDRFVGMFYFICNLYRGPNPPLDVTKLLAADPAHPDFQPGAAHYWGEPDLGYYLSSDPWVIRKHAYMLADAGVNTLIFDVTNNVTFPESYRAVCEVFRAVRAEGEATPDICFLASEESIRQLWDDLYAKGDYADLWFRWQGKPLLIFGQWEKFGDMREVVLPSHITDFFTIRQCWAWDSLPWYGDDGRHRWPWVAHYPQPIGWDTPGVAEQMPAAVGQHPLSGIGRSFHNGKEPETDEYDVTPYTPLGLHFQEQWKRVLEVDPEFVFVTGWNEWTAGAARCEDPSQEALQALWDFFPGATLGRAGRTLKPGDVYFIDQYNQEFSRDIEPMRGGHTDNYYYQLVANIRRYKGARPPVEPAGPITIDLTGDFAQWDAVSATYRDHQYDTLHRDGPGWGSEYYVNQTGRNEFVTLKAAHDADSLYFYARTREAISPPSDPNWMMLFLNADQQHETGWEGYDFVINRGAPEGDRVIVERNAGGWRWEPVGEARYRVEGNQTMLAIPRARVGLIADLPRFDFHWADNAPLPSQPDQLAGDVDGFFTDGDHAPPRRFDYRYGG